jgi:transcriptional regulator with XRE-family HTH domain
MKEAEEILRIIAALRTAIRLSGVSHREIERQLKMSTGYLTRIFGGHVQLRVAHVLSICQIIGLPADRFFAALYPPRPPTDESQARLIRGLSHLHPQPVETPDPERLLREIQAFLDEVKAQREKKK